MNSILALQQLIYGSTSCNFFINMRDGVPGADIKDKNTWLHPIVPVGCNYLSLCPWYLLLTQSLRICAYNTRPEWICAGCIFREAPKTCACSLLTYKGHSTSVIQALSWKSIDYFEQVDQASHCITLKLLTTCNPPPPHSAQCWPLKKFATIMATLSS